MSLFVAIEGSDGSGKETQTTLLRERLERAGWAVRRYDFPTYGQDPVADLIRSILRTMQEEWNTRPWESKAVLYASNRARFRDEIVGLLRQPRSVVVCNRYVPSNQAHMAGYADDPAEWERRFAWIARLEYDLMRLPRPDIVLLQTMPGTTAQQLITQRGVKDAHEEDVAYLARVEQCFRELAQRDPERWIHIPADVGGVVQTPVEVHERVWQVLARHPAWHAFARSMVSVRT